MKMKKKKIQLKKIIQITFDLLYIKYINRKNLFL